MRQCVSRGSEGAWPGGPRSCGGGDRGAGGGAPAARARRPTAAGDGSTGRALGGKLRTAHARRRRRSRPGPRRSSCARPAAEPRPYGGWRSRLGLALRVTAGPARRPSRSAVTLRPIPAGTLLGIPPIRPIWTTAARVRRDKAARCWPRARTSRSGGWSGPAYGDAVVDRLVEPLLGRRLRRPRRPALAGRGHARRCARPAQRAPPWPRAVRAALAAAPRPASPVFATVAGGLSRLGRRGRGAAGARSVRLGLPVRELRRTATGWRLVVGSTRDPVHRGRRRAWSWPCPARPAARLLPPSTARPPASGPLDYASVALVALALPAGHRAARAVGVPGAGRPRGSRSRRPRSSTSKWPHLRRRRARCSCAPRSAGTATSGVLQRTDADLVALARAELARAARRDAPAGPRRRRACPAGAAGCRSTASGHVDRVAAARGRPAADRLALAGAAYDGVGHRRLRHDRGGPPPTCAARGTWER